MSKKFPLYDGKNHSTKKLVRCPECNHLAKESTMRLHRCGGNKEGIENMKKLSKEFAADSRYNQSSLRSMGMRDA